MSPTDSSVRSFEFDRPAGATAQEQFAETAKLLRLRRGGAGSAPGDLPRRSLPSMQLPGPSQESQPSSLLRERTVSLPLPQPSMPTLSEQDKVQSRSLAELEQMLAQAMNQISLDKVVPDPTCKLTSCALLCVTL